MGFRTGAYCKVWSIEPKSDFSTKLRISINRKDKHTGEYEQDFSGYVTCIGTASASKAAKLNQGDRIKLGDVDVGTKYDADKKVTYYNFKIFSFDLAEDSKPSASETADPQSAVDDGVQDDNRELPF